MRGRPGVRAAPRRHERTGTCGRMGMRRSSSTLRRAQSAYRHGQQPGSVAISQRCGVASRGAPRAAARGAECAGWQCASEPPAQPLARAAPSMLPHSAAGWMALAAVGRAQVGECGGGCDGRPAAPALYFAGSLTSGAGGTAAFLPPPRAIRGRRAVFTDAQLDGLDPFRPSCRSACRSSFSLGLLIGCFFYCCCCCWLLFLFFD